MFGSGAFDSPFANRQSIAGENDVRSENRYLFLTGKTDKQFAIDRGNPFQLRSFQVDLSTRISSEFPPPEGKCRENGTWRS